jgi:uncharacterized membrane protein
MPPPGANFPTALQSLGCGRPGLRLFWLAFVLSPLFFPGEAAAAKLTEFEKISNQVVLWLVFCVELVGIGFIVFGMLVSFGIFLFDIIFRHDHLLAYHAFRTKMGRAILLGLEFLVAADIINTVAIDPTLRNLATLAIIISVRVFLSFALEVEIEGRWPWQRGSRP